MKVNLAGYVYIFLTIILTACGQFVLKWQFSQSGELAGTVMATVVFLLRLFGNVWILWGFGVALPAVPCWMASFDEV
ncbi:MAG: hypothetical protein GTO24_07620 [candidate division Zixibacteria bacterium]|nr:hypothetical protein [candidate division Zixibacteria bacterium]